MMKRGGGNILISSSPPHARASHGLERTVHPHGGCIARAASQAKSNCPSPALCFEGPTPAILQQRRSSPMFLMTSRTEKMMQRMVLTPTDVCSDSFDMRTCGSDSSYGGNHTTFVLVQPFFRTCMRGAVWHCAVSRMRGRR